MKSGSYTLAIALVLLVGALIAASALVAPGISRPSTPYANDLASLSFRPHPGAQLPLGTALVDEKGRKVTLGRYFTKSPVILVLEYLRCTSLCGVTLRNLIGGTLHKLPFEPGRDYQLIAISIDPRDLPGDAAAAAAKYRRLLNRSGGKAGLHFLVGASAAVRKIAGVVGFPYRYDKLLKAYIHPAGFIVASPDGLISRYFEGFSASSPDLVAAFADAEQDKSQGPLTRLLLLCHIQGVPLGRWTAPVMGALMICNIGAGLSLIALFAAIRLRRYG